MRFSILHMSQNDQREEFVRVAHFESTMNAMGQRLDDLERTFANNSRSMDEVPSKLRDDIYDCSRLMESLQNEILINREETRTCRDEIARWQHTVNDIFNKQVELENKHRDHDSLAIQRTEQPDNKCLRSVMQLLHEFETWILEKVDNLATVVNRLDAQSAITADVGDVVSPRLEDLSAPLKLPLITSGLPGVRALKDLASQLERPESFAKYLNKRT